MAIDDPDVPALLLAGVVLGAGSGLTGRIPQRIREEEGLAYLASATTLAGAGLDPGRLVIHLGTSPATARAAERAAIEELRRFVEDGPNEEEVREARSYLLGRDPFLRETARQWANTLAESLYYRLPLWDASWRLERLRHLDRPDVHAAVRRHLDPARLTVVRGRPRA